MFCLKIYFFLIICYFNFIVSPPITNVNKDENESDDFDIFKDIDYSSYLNEVIKELHTDEEFAKRMNVSEDSLQISDNLKFASARVRSKLDELKRIEINRLSKLQKELDKRKSEPHKDPLEMPPSVIKEKVDLEHIDHQNPASFSSDDLKKLIDKTSSIFEKMERKNEEEYKKHEMEKEARKKAEFDAIADKKKREEEEKKWHDELQYKRSHHDNIPEPGSFDHLLDVWKNNDKMDEESFNPRVFFMTHDINQDGYLDIGELEALLQTELDKAYPLDNMTDFIERYHEMIRMRNRFIDHVDKDKNKMVSLDEFLDWSKTAEYKNHEAWKTQEELDKPFSDEEFQLFYKAYIEKHPEFYHPPLNVDGASTMKPSKPSVPKS